MSFIRVDGNDLFAIYSATKQAREIILREKRPVLIEAISYRVGDHSTSDFSQRYRDETEMKKVVSADPYEPLLKPITDDSKIQITKAMS